MDLPPLPPQTRVVTVSYHDQQFRLSLPTTAVVLDLKIQLSLILDVPVERQVVSCSMNHMFEIPDHIVLSNAIFNTVFNIDTVMLRVRLQVWVRVIGTDVRQSVSVFDISNGRKIKEIFRDRFGFGAPVMAMQLGVFNPATNEVVTIDEGIPFYNIVYPVPIVNGTELYLFF